MDFPLVLALKALHLKTVVKEHHGKAVQQLVFNAVDAGSRNLFATFAANQATVYDSEHFSTFIAVVQQFVNVATAHTAGGDLTAACWLPTAGLRDHTHGDGRLALGASDGLVSILSLASASITALLRGHTAAVTDLASVASRPALLASCSKDGSARVWDARAAACLAVAPLAGVASLAFSPDGRTLFAGATEGRVVFWGVADPLAAASDGAATPPPWPAPRRFPSPTPPPHGAAVDSVLPLPGGRLATKSSEGRVAVWDVSASDAPPRLVSAWRVPGHSAGDRSARLGASHDGSLILCGGPPGELHVYDAADGKRLVTLAGGKVKSPMLACAMAGDGKWAMAASGGGLVLRWETIAVEKAFVPPNAADGGEAPEG